MNGGSELERIMQKLPKNPVDRVVTTSALDYLVFYRLDPDQFTLKSLWVITEIDMVRIFDKMAESMVKHKAIVVADVQTKVLADQLLIMYGTAIVPKDNLK